MKQYDSNIEFPFAIDAGLGRFATGVDYGIHVEQMIRQVLFTNPGERVNRPDFGCGIRRMVFAPNSDVTASLTQTLVRQSLDKWLGAVISVDAVKVRAENEALAIHISYLLKARMERKYLNLEVTL